MSFCVVFSFAFPLRGWAELTGFGFGLVGKGHLAYIVFLFSFFLGFLVFFAAGVVGSNRKSSWRDWKLDFISFHFVRLCFLMITYLLFAFPASSID